MDREFWNRVEQEAFERGRAAGRPEGRHSAMRESACADPARVETARQYAWACRWCDEGEEPGGFNPPAEGWPDEVLDVDLFVEQYVDEHVLHTPRALATGDAQSAGPLTKALQQLMEDRQT
jgi:hypothetical protein